MYLFCHKFLFFRYYHVKIQFIVSFEYHSHSLQQSIQMYRRFYLGTTFHYLFDLY